MLYSKTDLSLNDPISFLNKAYYLGLDESMSVLHPSTIPVIFNEEIERTVVDYNILSVFSEEHELSLAESIDILAEYNQIPTDSLVIAIDEYKIIENPDLINMSIPLVIKSVNEDSFDVLFTDYLLESYIETGDEFFLEAEVDPQKARKAMHDFNKLMDDVDTIRNTEREKWVGDKFKTSDDAKNYLAHNRQTLSKVEDLSGKFLDKFTNEKNAANVETAKKDINAFISQINTEIEHAPRTWLAKKIQSLRLLYSTWLAKSQMAVNLKQANFFKMIATKIMTLIDKAMFLLQKGANKIGKVDYRYGVTGKW